MKKLTFLFSLLLSAISLHANDAEIEALIERTSDVQVTVINDSIFPWFVLGQDTIGCVYDGSSYWLDDDCGVKSEFSIRYSSEKTTQLYFDKFSSRSISSLYIDSIEYPTRISGYYKTDPQYHYLAAGTHTITFVSSDHNVSPKSPAALINISIQEIDDAMEPMILRWTEFGYNIYPKFYYDYTYSQILQPMDINGSKGYHVDLANGCISVTTGFPQGSNFTFQNINNDDCIDALTESGSGSSKKCIAYLSHGHSFADTTEYVLSGTSLLDFNNDGYPDFVGISTNEDKQKCVANTIYNTGMSQNYVNLYTVEAYVQEYQEPEKEISNTTNIQHINKPQRIIKQNRQDALTSMSIVNVRAGNAAATAKRPADIPIDVNGDGVVDYINTKITGSGAAKSVTKQLFLNMGGGDYVFQNVQGDLIDLNSDGIMDLIGHDGTDVVYYILQPDGTYQKHQFNVGVVHNEVWCYDFDKDGDKDILLAYNYNKSWNGSYLVMLENTNDGQYQSHEYFYLEQLLYPECIDFDNDGYYEIIWLVDKNSTDQIVDDICHLDVNGMTISESPIYWNIDNFNFNHYARTSGFIHNIIDSDNDGILELWAPRKYYIQSARDYEHSMSYMKLSTTANTKPNKPNAPKVVYDYSIEQVAISWDLGSDKETSPVDLTYALRIGTEPGKGDVVYAHAHPDGTRRNFIGGNMSTNRYRVLNTNTWKPGKYYVSIQAIDPNNRGSEFSEEVVFEKKSQVASFEMMYNADLFGVGDTCTVFLHPNVVLDTTYQLTCSNGEIVSISNDSLTMQIVFFKAGEQKISLYGNNNNNIRVVKCEKTISVAPFRCSQSKTIQSTRVALDLNEDGNMEFYGDYNGETKTSHFHTYATDGSISRINKMFNNNTAWDYGAPFTTIDINKDGKVDVFAGDSYEGTVFTALNTGNLNMSVNSSELMSIEPTIDFNNDGWFDEAPSWNSSLSGYYLTSSTPNYNTFDIWECPKPYAIKDFTNDGLVDILYEYEYKDAGYRYHYILYENNGDFTFTPRDTLFQVQDELHLFNDFDNDGKLDVVHEFAVEDDYDHCGIIWGDGTQTIFTGIHEVRKEGVFDYNNDGYLDLFAKIWDNGNLDSKAYCVILILPNHKYEVITSTSLLSTLYNLEPPHAKAYVSPDGNIQFLGKGSEVITLYPPHNTQPAAPTNISAAQSEKGVMITWEHSHDAETPAIRMRYNISVKHKGKTGEGAYLISPCNSTKNGVPVPSHLPLIESNRFLIPTASIQPGEYEIQVQGVDLHQWQSDFSEVYNLIVKETIAIEAPAVTGVGKETTVKIASNVSTNIDWDGGYVIDTIGNQYIVIWDSIGMKSIAAGDDTHLINVKPLPDATFTLPEQVIQLATVEADAHNAREGKWSISVNSGKTFVSCNESDVIDILSVDTANVILRFNKAGKYIIRRTIAGEFGDAIYEQNTIVTSEHIAPEISTVTNAHGHYQVIWKQSKDMPSEVIGYRLYKESSYTGVYDLVAELDKDSFMCIDVTSNPNVQSSRYALSYITTYGESTKSTPHQGLHVMINRGVGTTWNLAWMKYEGRDIATYRIWRGTTPDNISVIGEISGNMTSYSDLMTGDSINYYAVEVIFVDNSQTSLPTRRFAPRSSGISAMSNIISTASVNEVAFVEHIDVLGEDIIAGNNNTSQIYAYISPYYASYKAVNFVVVQGSDIADIDAQGVLTANGYSNGDVIVRAYALDGSNVFGETTIDVRGFDDIFTISYMINGEIVQRDEVSYGSTIVAPESTKEGYSLVWYNLPKTMPAHDIIVEGEYVINTYTITYVVDEATYAIDTLAYGENITLRLEPIRDGYTFSGWSAAPSTMPAHDVVVSGTFTINNYDIIYMVDGAEYKRVSVVYGEPITLEAEPTKEGHTFRGWSDVPETMPAHDVVVEGSFTINKYLLTYMVEGKVFATDSITFGAPIELIEGPEKEGYTFAWEREQVPSNMPAYDVVINGVFTINSYNIIYMVDGAEYKRVSVVYGESITLEAEPTKEGHTFSGWSDVPETMPAHDVVVEGSFSVNYYALTYIVDNEWYATDSIAYDDVIELREEPTKEGYVFSGWSEVPETMPAHNVEVQGMFTLITSVNNVIGTEGKNTHKILHEDHIYILRDGKTYNVMGQEL